MYNRNDFTGGQDMKKIILITLAMMVLPVISHGAGYILANYGDGGKVHASSYGLELGGIFLSPYHPHGGAFSLGIGASIANTDENQSSSFTGKFKDGNEQEIYASFGAEIVPAFFGVVGVGYASQDTKTNNGNGTSSGTDNFGTWMLGMRYVVKSFDIGLGYDYRRGVTATLGVAF
jgi:hypothetical protein